MHSNPRGGGGGLGLIGGPSPVTGPAIMGGGGHAGSFISSIIDNQ